MASTAPMSQLLLHYVVSRPLCKGIAILSFFAASHALVGYITCWDLGSSVQQFGVNMCDFGTLWFMF